MLIVKAQLTIAPEHKSVFLDAVRTFVDQSRDEPGCLDIGCYEDTAEANSFVVFQQWTDQATFEAHETSAHLAQFKARIGVMVVSREPTRVYSVIAAGRLPARQ